MRFHDSGSDIPEALIRAQLAGETVFVVGAGVSQRVGLPLFEGLVANVYARLGQGQPGTSESLADSAETEAWKRKEWDRVLGLLERRLVYQNPKRPEIDNPVRATVAHILEPPQRSLIPHIDVLALSRDVHGRARVTTTNFDTLLERAWRDARGSLVGSFSGPGFPAIGSPEFHGILHLHGRTADAELHLEPTELVLSSADFGEAYLRSGWASRFIYDLLRRYTLVFVGYAADDPPMRYMLEATEAGRLRFPDLRRAYAFVEVPDGDAGRVRELWRAKGLDPITFDNADHSFDLLYRTLAAWAECSRDPASWAEKEIKRIVARPWAEADTETRTKISFLVETIASSATLSKHAISPDWINCLIKTEAHAPLLDGDGIVWFDRRLNDPEMARWALKAPAPVKMKAANAISWLLSSKEQPTNPLSQFWRLFVVESEDRPNRRAGVDWMAVQKILKLGKADFFAINAITDIVRPRLRLEQPWKFATPEKPESDTAELRLSDLCRVTFACEDWPKHDDILAAWPNDAVSERRLIESLDRASAAACELATESGLIADDRDSISRDVRLVHMAAPADLAPVISDPQFNRANWKPTHQDDFDHSFVPIVRLLSGLWLRLAQKDGKRASAIARSWMGRDTLLFRRLGYWAATVSEHGPRSEGAAALSHQTVETFWLRELTPEAAGFWCTRWNSLPTEAREAIETLVIDGPNPDWFWFASAPEQKQRAHDFRRYQELCRIVTAGGSLSSNAIRALDNLKSRYETFPSQVGLLEGLYHVSWSGSGGSGDVGLVENVPIDELLQRVEAIEKADQFNQGDLWEKLCRTKPQIAFVALIQESSVGKWPAHRWQSFLSSMIVDPKQDVARADRKAVAALVVKMPDDALTTIVDMAPLWLRSLSNVADDTGLRQITLEIWDRLFAIVCRQELGKKGATKSLFEKDILHKSLSDPIGQLTGVLINLQDKSKAEGAGLSPDLLPRFDALIRLPELKRVMALAELTRPLAFFYWLAPKWTEQNLFPALDSDGEEARALLDALMKYGQYATVEIFNRLKARIAAAIVDPVSEDALKGLADFVTWAALNRIAGNVQINLPELEARQLLTRASATALQSVAWSLWRSLASQKVEERSNYWKRHMEPFFTNVWPNDVVARNENTSKMLLKIPANAGDSLPAAAKIILNLVIPIREYTIIHGFDIHDKPDLMARFPREILELVSAGINLETGIPYDLKDFLEKLASVAPELKIDTRYQRLNGALRQSS